LLSEPPGHEAAKEKRHGSSSNESSVSWKVLWLINHAVSETRNNTTQVTEADVHSNTDTTLGRPSNVVSVPSNTHWDVGVDTASGKEGTEVLNGWLGGGNQHDESNN